MVRHLIAPKAHLGGRGILPSNLYHRRINAIMNNVLLHLTVRCGTRSIASVVVLFCCCSKGGEGDPDALPRPSVSNGIETSVSSTVPSPAVSTTPPTAPSTKSVLHYHDPIETRLFADRFGICPMFLLWGHARCPSDWFELTNWAGKQGKGKPAIRDPWSTPYQVRCSDAGVWLRSCGADRKCGSDDDVVEQCFGAEKYGGREH